MTTNMVILVCLGSIAACAALIFTVEILIAFVFSQPDESHNEAPQLVLHALRERNASAEAEYMNKKAA